MATHFLYITNTRVTSLVARAGRIAERREFEASEGGVAAFNEYLNGRLAGIPARIIADVAEEDFRVDTVPHVGTRDREAIVGRKLAQMFRNTPFRHGAVQGREPDGRRDDRVAYTAITNPDVLRPWVDTLEARHVPLEGIHSAAVLSARLLEVLDLAFPQVLLVLFSPGGALRQTYFRDGEIKFSRLTPYDTESAQGLGEVLLEETSRTWQYLDNLRQLAADSQGHVCVVAHPRDRAAIEPALRDFSKIPWSIVDIEQAAQKVGLKPPPRTSSAEELLVHLFLARPVDNHFATPEMRRYATLRRARHALDAAAAVVLAVAIGVGGWNLSQLFDASDADKRTGREIGALNREFDGIARSLPSVGVGGAAMRDTVTFHERFLRRFPALSDFLIPLSEVLERHPRVRLTQVAWQASDDPRATPAILPNLQTVQPPVRSMGKAGEAAPRPADDATNPPFPSGRYEIALIEATVGVANNDFRGALAEVEQLAADVGKVKGLRADLIESPLDLRPSLAVQGRHGEREPGRMEARFLLRIVRSPEGSA